MGERLGKTIKEVGDLSVEEYAGWIAYFKIQAAEEKKATDKARAKAKKKR